MAHKDENCPKCGEPLKPNASRCWTKGCDFSRIVDRPSNQPAWLLSAIFIFGGITLAGLIYISVKNNQDTATTRQGSFETVIPAAWRHISSAPVTDTMSFPGPYYLVDHTTNKPLDWLADVLNKIKNGVYFTDDPSRAGTVIFLTRSSKAVGTYGDSAGKAYDYEWTAHIVNTSNHDAGVFTVSAKAPESVDYTRSMHGISMSENSLQTVRKNFNEKLTELNK